MAAVERAAGVHRGHEQRIEGSCARHAACLADERPMVLAAHISGHVSFNMVAHGDLSSAGLGL